MLVELIVLLLTDCLIDRLPKWSNRKKKRDFRQEKSSNTTSIQLPPWTAAAANFTVAIKNKDRVTVTGKKEFDIIFFLISKIIFIFSFQKNACLFRIVSKRWRRLFSWELMSKTIFLRIFLHSRKFFKSLTYVPAIKKTVFPWHRH